MRTDMTSWRPRRGDCSRTCRCRKPPESRPANRRRTGQERPKRGKRGWVANSTFGSEVGLLVQSRLLVQGLLELIFRSGSETSIGELVAGTGRRRDNVRRTLRKLEARQLVECCGETVHLVADFAAALKRELEVSGITRSERLDRERYEREREAYREHLKDRRRRKRKPDGTTSDLKRVEVPEGTGIPGSAPQLDQEPESAPDVVITDAGDPEEFRELVALARRQISEHRRKHPPNHPPRIRGERVGTLLPEDVAVLEAIEAFEVKHGPGSFKWNQAGAKELFYSVAGGHWPLPNQLRRIREHVEALARVVAA